MKIFKFKYKKAQMNLYFVLIIVIFLSATLFLNTDKKIMMSIIYLSAAVFTFINVINYVNKSKKAVKSISVDNSSIIINFMHVMVDPIKIQKDEFIIIEKENKLIIKKTSKEDFEIIINKGNLINILEWDDLVLLFREHI